jgi:hypothetical protein
MISQIAHIAALYLKGAASIFERTSVETLGRHWGHKKKYSGVSMVLPNNN